MEIITVKEAAQLLRASESFLYKHYRSLSGFKIAGLIRFDKQQLIDNLTTGGKENDKGE